MSSSFVWHVLGQAEFFDSFRVVTSPDDLAVKRLPEDNHTRRSSRCTVGEGEPPLLDDRSIFVI